MRRVAEGAVAFSRSKLFHIDLFKRYDPHALDKLAKHVVCFQQIVSVHVTNEAEILDQEFGKGSPSETLFAVFGLWDTLAAFFLEVILTAPWVGMSKL